MTDGPTDSGTPGVPEHGKKKRAVVEPEPPARVMSIHAHPDDQEFTVGGTLAKWSRAGSTVVTVCITRGTGGSNKFTPPDMTREALGPIREAEQRNACRILGISDAWFLDYEDGMLEATIALRRDLTRLIRRFRPSSGLVAPDIYSRSNPRHPRNPLRNTRRSARLVSTAWHS